MKQSSKKITNNDIEKIHQHQEEEEDTITATTASSSRYTTNNNINTNSINSSTIDDDNDNNDEELLLYNEWENKILENGINLINKLETFCFSHSKSQQQQGLSLPIHAIAWLYHCIYKQNDNECLFIIDPLVRERIHNILKNGFNKIHHLRISNDTWPVVSNTMTAASNAFNNNINSSSTCSVSSNSSISSNSNSTTNNNNNNQVITKQNKNNIISIENNKKYQKLNYYPNINLFVLFPNIKVLLCKNIPPEYLENSIYNTRKMLEVIRLEYGCVYNFYSFFYPTSSLSSSKNNNNYKSLTHLKLTHCSINDSTFYNSQQKLQRLFNNLSSLKCISLSNNNITNVQNIVLPYLSSLINLHTLDISHNNINCMNECYKYLGNITTLNISYNNLSSVQGIDHLYSLKNLDVSFNGISCITNKFGKLPDLMHLGIVGNPIIIPDNQYYDSNNTMNNGIHISTRRFKINNKQHKEDNNDEYYRIYIYNQFYESRCLDDINNNNAAQENKINYTLLKTILPSIDNTVFTKYEYDKLQHFKQTFISYPNHFVQYSTSFENNNISIINKVLPLKILQQPSISNIRKVIINDYKIHPCRDNDNNNNRMMDTTTNNLIIKRNVNINFTLNDIVSNIESPNIIQYYDSDNDNDEQSKNNNVDNKHHDKESSIVKVEEKEDVIQSILSSIQTSADCTNTTHFKGTNNNASKKSLLLESKTSLSSEFNNATSSSSKQQSLHKSSSSPMLAENTTTVTATSPGSKNAHTKPIEDNTTTNTSTTAVNNNDAKKDLSAITTNKTVESATTDDNNKTVTKSNKEDDNNSNDDNTNQSKKSIPTTLILPKNTTSANTKPSVRIIPKETQQVQQEQLNTKTLFLKHQKMLTSKNTNIDHPYDGDTMYNQVNVLNYLELYFRHYIFQQGTTTTTTTIDDIDNHLSLEQKEKQQKKISLFPRIQISNNKDDDIDYKDILYNLPKYILDEKSNIETLIDVWCEPSYYVLPYNKNTINRIHNKTRPNYSFHGDEVLLEVSTAKLYEPLHIILCLSNIAFYFISYNNIKKSNIFIDAIWPNALSRHSLKYLKRITIGYSFQRLILHFSVPTFDNKKEKHHEKDEQNEFIYCIITCNKLRTISLLQKLRLSVTNINNTTATSASSSNNNSNNELIIDNDDKIILDALGKLWNNEKNKANNASSYYYKSIFSSNTSIIANSNSTNDMIGSIMHYQIIKQKWSSTSIRGLVPRTIILTDTCIFLLDEIFYNNNANTINNKKTIKKDNNNSDDDNNNYNVNYALIDIGSLSTNDIIEIKSGIDGDPKNVTIILKPLSFYSRHRNWRLVCNDRDGAEKLVDDVRKVISS